MFKCVKKLLGSRQKTDSSGGTSFRCEDMASMFLQAMGTLRGLKPQHALLEENILCEPFFFKIGVISAPRIAPPLRPIAPAKQLGLPEVFFLFREIS